MKVGDKVFLKPRDAVENKSVIGLMGISGWIYDAIVEKNPQTIRYISEDGSIYLDGGRQVYFVFKEYMFFEDINLLESELFEI